MSHGGVDIVYVISGELTLNYNGRDYLLTSRACTVLSGGYPHGYRNHSNSRAIMFAIVTDTVF
jgi:quercetin dioxygenase-like cupin family protein